MGDAVDRGPAGRYQRVYQEKRRVYREYRLVEKGVPVLGVIYVPVRKELYFASSSVGAYKFTGIDSSSQPSMDEMKQRAIHLPMALAHQGVVVVASRSHQTEETTAFIDNLRKQGKPVTLISSGSSLKICLVAEGSADIYPRFARRWSGIPPPATPSPSLPVATYIISTARPRFAITRKICIIRGLS